MPDPNGQLTGSPYLVPEDERSLDAFGKTQDRSAQVAERALRAWSGIADEADALLSPFVLALRSDLVAQSNQIEDNDVSAASVQETVLAHRELLAGPAHGLFEVLRSDPKILNALGLYKAQQLADEWAQRRMRPYAYELRQLHQLITADDRFGGRYRTHDVAIGGTAFRPPSSYDVAKCMDDYTHWWQDGSDDPVLDAAVAHAWLTHIHPYEDGNGRLARVLANLVLTARKYPPLIVRAEADRGQYYDALQESDSGNILPLYALFAQVIGRTARTMSRANYVKDVLEGRLFASVEDQRALWCQLLANLRGPLRQALAQRRWSSRYQGTPDASSFSALADRDSTGNGWLEEVVDPGGQRQWLLWAGYNSPDLIDLLDGPTGFPSIFISHRDLSPHAPHPYLWEQGLGDLPDELLLRPLERRPVFWRHGYRIDELTPEDAAARLANALVG
jgi:fido (protein-threonine AMPylation protein)